MVKAKIGSLTKKWIDGKTEKQLVDKIENRQNAIEKTKLTVYIGKDVVKSLWHHRAETSEPMSHTVEKLIRKHLGKTDV